MLLFPLEATIVEHLEGIYSSNGTLKKERLITGNVLTFLNSNHQETLQRIRRES